MTGVGSLIFWRRTLCLVLFAAVGSAFASQNFKPFPTEESLMNQRTWAWEFIDSLLTEAANHQTSPGLSKVFSKTYPLLSGEEKSGQIPISPDKFSIDDQATLFEDLQSPTRTFYSPSAGLHPLSQFHRLTECLKFSSLSASSRAYCLGEEFPMGSYVVKLAWSRLQETKGVRIAITTDDSLARLPQQNFEWQDFAPASVPSPFVLRLGPQEAYALVGIHVMSKSTPDWVWMSAWWSPEDSSNFAQDRPSYLKSDWLRQSKLCHVDRFEAYDLSDPKLENLNSLKASLHRLQEENLNHSWCSNPFVEHGKGNARSNCIGCHQHAGTEVGSSELLKGSLKNPLKLVGKNNTKVPLDYSWSLIQGERALGLELVDWREYFETHWSVRSATN